MSATPLRVVGASEPQATNLKPMTVTKAADAGSRRDLLVALRSRIARAVSSRNTPPRDLAALSLRLIDIAKEIEAIDAAAEREDPGASIPDDEPWDAG